MFFTLPLVSLIVYNKSPIRARFNPDGCVTSVTKPRMTDPTRAGCEVSTTFSLNSLPTLSWAEFTDSSRTHAILVPVLNVCDDTYVVASAGASSTAAAARSAANLTGKVRYTKLFSIKSRRLSQRIDAVHVLPR